MTDAGADKHFGGTAAEAKQLALDAVGDLIQDRHEDIHLCESYEAWTPWFRDTVWDITWLLVDRRALEVTVLCATDSD